MSRSASLKDRLKAIDTHVGKRLRTARNLAGMSQEKLAELSELTFQQVQKYEKGSNRIAASGLSLFARILNVPVVWFFEGSPAAAEADDPHSRETIAMIRAFHRLPAKKRRIFYLFLKALVATEESK